MRTLLPALLLLVSTHAFAVTDTQLDVGGSVQAGADALEVRVDLTNRGTAPIDQLSVEGELFAHLDDARFTDEVKVGETKSVLLKFPLSIPTPGTHAVALNLEYRTADAAHTPMRQRAYLLLTLGAVAGPVVKLQVAEVELEALAAVPVTLESVDGKPHRVQLRLLAPRGMNPLPQPAAVDVPATGSVTSTLPVLRAGAVRGSRQGVLVLAETTEDGLAHTTVQAGLVQIATDPARMPKWRQPLAAVAGLLLLAAVGLEVRAARERRRIPPPGPTVSDLEPPAPLS